MNAAVVAGTRTCPNWCIAPHDEDDAFHFQQTVEVETSSVGALKVAVSWDERTGRLVVEVGEQDG